MARMFSTDLAGADAMALEKVQLAKITSPQAPYGKMGEERSQSQHKMGVRGKQ